MDEICGFIKASTLSFVSMATLFCPQIKYPLWCFFQRTKWVFFFFFRFVLLKAWQISEGPAGSVLTWPVHNWPQTLMWYGHIDFLRCATHWKSTNLSPLLWKYSASAYFLRIAEGWQFFDVAFMYTSRQDSIS